MRSSLGPVWHGQHVLPTHVLKRSGVCRRLRQDTFERLAAFDRGLAPNVFLHALRRRNPGPSRFAPAGRGGDCLFQSQLVRESRRVLEGILPLGRHVGKTFLHHLRRREGSVKILEPAEADAMHPLQVELDALPGDVAVHPVPPNSRPRALGWILKTAFERIGRALGECAH